MEYSHIRRLMMKKRRLANIAGLKDIQAQIPQSSFYLHRDAWFFSSGLKCQDLSDKVWFQDSSRQELIAGSSTLLWPSS